MEKKRTKMISENTPNATEPWKRRKRSESSTLILIISYPGGVQHTLGSAATRWEESTTPARERQMLDTEGILPLQAVLDYQAKWNP